MIRSYFGLARNPFDPDGQQLLAHQQEILEVLRVHCQQGGLCLVAGEPGTGKSAIRTALTQLDPKRLVTPTVSRTLHTYHNTIRILSQAFEIEFEGGDFKVDGARSAEMAQPRGLRGVSGAGARTAGGDANNAS